MSPESHLQMKDTFFIRSTSFPLIEISVVLEFLHWVEIPYSTTHSVLFVKYTTESERTMLYLANSSFPFPCLLQCVIISCFHQDQMKLQWSLLGTQWYICCRGSFISSPAFSNVQPSVLQSPCSSKTSGHSWASIAILASDMRKPMNQKCQ